MQRLRRLATAQISPSYEWGFVIVAFGLAFGTRYWLEGLLPPGFPYLTFFPAVILTGFFAGTRAGTVVAVLCGIASWYVFLAPQFSWHLSGPSVLALIFYIFIVATDLFLIDVMRQALARLDEEKKVSDRLVQQNKTMFHELQHRVSNNLQVISSLLKMQQRNLEAGPAKSALEVASARLEVVAFIQRQLHNPKRQSVDLGTLLKSLLPEVVESSGSGNQVDLTFDTKPVIVSGDQATPIALIAVELISNALEHATVEGKATHIAVSIIPQDQTVALRIADNGRGLPEGFQPEKSRSLGLRVAHQFADQLGGELTFESQSGTIVTLTFPLSTDAASDDS